MGWIEKAKEIVKGLKESGKSEKEISEIIEVAADKATVNKDVIKEQFVGKEEIEMIADTMIKIGETAEQVATAISKMCSWFGTDKKNDTNNWRKMHGLPMRRKRK